MSTPLNTPLFDDNNDVENVQPQIIDPNTQSNNNNNDNINQEFPSTQKNDQLKDTKSSIDNVPDTYPEETKWKFIWKCCGNHVARIMPASRVYCGYWEISPFMPITVVFFVIYCFLIHIIIFVPRQTNIIRISSLIEISIFMLLFTLCKTNL